MYIRSSKKRLIFPIFVFFRLVFVNNSLSPISHQPHLKKKDPTPQPSSIPLCTTLSSYRKSERGGEGRKLHIPRHHRQRIYSDNSQNYTHRISAPVLWAVRMSHTRDICHRIYRTTDRLLFLVVCGTLPDRCSDFFFVSRTSFPKWVECRAEGGNTRRRGRTDDGGTFIIAWSPLRFGVLLCFCFLTRVKSTDWQNRALWRM